MSSETEARADSIFGLISSGAIGYLAFQAYGFNWTSIGVTCALTLGGTALARVIALATR